MKRLLIILCIAFCSIGVYAQKIEDLPRATVSTGTDLIIVDQTDATRGISVLNFLGTISSDVHTTENFIGDTLFFVGDSTYITGAGDSIKFFVDDSGVLTLVDLGGGYTQALFDDGVVYAPSIAFLSDPNTGLWRSNPDAIAVVAGGVRGILVTETADAVVTTFSDDVIITDLASANTLVLTPTATGQVDTLETTDLATADITVTGDWDMDTTIITNLTVADVSDTLKISGAGVLSLHETTTPTAMPDYGKVYTKSDNELYFQDGGGTEHTVTTDLATADITATGDWTLDNVVIDSLDADTISADYIKVNTMFDWNPPHAHLAFNDSAITLDMTQSEWSQVTNTTNTLFTENELVNMTFAGDSLTIDAGYGGDYIVNLGLSFAGTASDDYEICLFKNNAILGVIMEVETTGTNNTYVGLPTYIDGAVAGDDLKLMIRNTASADDAVILACSWVIYLLHP